jgi:glycosyltransferase involved in cell wall biosynthesis
LSDAFEGDIVALWVASEEDSAQRLPGIARAIGRFRFHFMLTRDRPPIIKQLVEMGFMIRTARELARRQGPYDLIVTYGAYRTALAGYLVKRLIGGKLVIEFPGHPTRSYELASGIGNAVKRRVAPYVIRFLARRADHLRLLYPWQLDDVVGAAPLGPSTGRQPSRSSFHDFVPVSLVPPRSERPERVILFIGFPWGLKGVATLIAAFHEIADAYTDVRLCIVGHCPDRGPWEALRRGHPRIEFSAPVPNDRVMQMMTECAMFVLPSKTEAAARVLLEAMAAGTPIVASRVDGTPHYVRDGENGLLFTSGDHVELAAQMRRILDDPALGERLGRRARELVVEHHSEASYVRQYTALGRMVAAQRG